MSIVVVLGLVAAGIALVRWRSGDDTAAPTPSTTTAPAPAAPEDPATADPGPSGTGGFTVDEEALGEEVAALRRFAEEQRGLRFTRDVEVTVLAPEPFQAEVARIYAAEEDAIRNEGTVLAGSGLTPPGYDVVAGQIELARASVLGFYDPKTKRLVVRGGGRFTPFLRRILVHELVHALDDQHVSLDRPELENVTDERSWAFAAVVEGSARRVELAYVEQLSEDDTATMEQEQFRLGMEQQQTVLGVPLTLVQMQSTPYVHGEPFVTALVEEGGTAALDEALRNPPTTSEQVLDPDRYRAREAPIDVPVPPVGGTVERDGTFGELGSAFLVQGAETNALWDRLAKGTMTPEDLRKLQELTSPSGDLRPIETVKGWGGDRYVLYRAADGKRCLRVDWRMDFPTARDNMRKALQAWSAGDPTVQLTEPDPELLRATRCTSAG